MAEAQFGYGFQDPNDGADDHNATAFLVQRMLARLNTMIPVEVKAVAGGGTAARPATVDVLPLVDQVDGGGKATPHGTVHGIPVVRVGGGDSAVVADPKVGDIGFVVVAQRDISAVKTKRGRASPGSFRRFDLADGVYVGAILSAPPAQWLAFTDDGLEIHDRNGNSAVFSATGLRFAGPSGNVVEIKATGTFVTGILDVSGAIVAHSGLQLDGALTGVGGGTYAGNLHVAGTVSADTEVVAKTGGAAVHVSTHVHTSATAGNPTSAPTPGT